MSQRRASHGYDDEWLELLERLGPFLTRPVLKRVWPAGLEPVPREVMDETRPAYEEWREDPAGQHRRWIGFVLCEVLDWGGQLRQGPDVPVGMELAMPEHGATIRADFAFVAPDDGVRLLGIVLAPGTHPTARGTDGWSASATERLSLLLRRHQVPLGLTTDGRRWALVWAPEGGATSVTVWDGTLWLEERDTLAAFRCLLERRRFLGVAEDQTLPALLSAGLAQQEEITETLGRQVRLAVEMLVEAMGRAGRRGGPAEGLLAAVEPDEVYHGAVTVMMRLLFLLYAEERRLLPADDEIYLESYSAGRLVDSLRAEANLGGEEALELRTAAWQRLLSLFRGIHGGIAHDRLPIRAYGGVIFDPDRHPWLEGRGASEVEEASVLPIDDRTVLHALEALQFVTVAGERRRLSFRTLDVEQIGYVYEGLLGYDARRAAEPVLGLQGRSGEEPERPISELEVIGPDVKAMAELTGLSEARVSRLLATVPDLQGDQMLRMACSGDEQLMERVRPFAALLRTDLRGLPVVVPAGGLYVTASPRRRLSGTHYTPRDLAERVVIGALEPLVYSPGPLDTDDRSQWKRRPSTEILKLKVADIAMGSGAFLVSASRYLAGELIAAWTAETDPRVAERGDASIGPLEDPESDPIVIEARRQIIEHCLYGGDINSMAVEMAKLSLWLVSLSRERPFSFLDDRLVCGDSLLGLTSLEQLRMMHLDLDEAKKVIGGRGFDLWGAVRSTLDEIERLRGEIADRPLLDVRDAQMKARLLVEAETAARPLSAIADALVGAAMAGRDPAQVSQAASAVLREADTAARETRMAELANSAVYELDTDRPEGAFVRRPTHWPLAFPEVFEGGGFDAVIGNPPFLGGMQMPTYLGPTYCQFLKLTNSDSRGAADLVVYFFRRAFDLIRSRAVMGLLATNSISETVNRRVGLEVLAKRGAQIFNARRSFPWPGSNAVSVTVAQVHLVRDRMVHHATLDGAPVSAITTSLTPEVLDFARAARLSQGIDYSEGTKLYGDAFIFRREELPEMMAKNPGLMNYVRIYVNGDVLNGTPRAEGDLVVVDFGEREKDQIKGCDDVIAYLTGEVGRERRNQTRQIHERRPWLHWDKRLPFYRKARKLPRILACTIVSRHLSFLFVDPNKLFAHGIKLFADDRSALFGILQSRVHDAWARATSSRLGQTVRYSTSTTFDTFPLSAAHLDRPTLTAAADHYLLARQRCLDRWQVGPTDVYRLFHDDTEQGADVEDLRRSQDRLDLAVLDAFELPHPNGFAFHALGDDNGRSGAGRKKTRYTWSPEFEETVLVQLLRLNDQYSQQESNAAGPSRKAATLQLRLTDT